MFCIIGDGEINEGQCWEAIQFAAHQQLDNLIVFVDDNKKQLDGRTCEICQTFDFVEKFKAFGFEAICVDGRDIQSIYDGILQMQQSTSTSPKCIVLDTVKGQGVPEIEEFESNHHIRPTSEQRDILENAVKQLKEELEGIHNERS